MAGHQLNDEDDDDWEALEVPTASIASSMTNELDQRLSFAKDATKETLNANSPGIQDASSSAKATARAGSTQKSKLKLEALQQRLDAKVRFKKNLVDQPLQLWMSRFLYYLLVVEVQDLTPLVRLALLFILIGSTLQAVLVVTWYLCYPSFWLRVLLLLVVVVGPLAYLFPVGFVEAFQSLQTAFSSKEGFSEIMGQVGTSSGVRRWLVLSGMILVPTVLESWTLHILTKEQSHVPWIHWYNLLVALIVGAGAMFGVYVHRCTPRVCTWYGILALYGTSWISILAVCVTHFSWGSLYRALWFSAPMIIVSGLLLLLLAINDNEMVAHRVQRAVQCSVRDVLVNLKDTVQQDEMLQLAMLRWIADYWAAGAGSTNPLEKRDVSNKSSSGMKPTLVQPESDTPAENTLQWQDIRPMLVATADQMSVEVEALQQSNRSGHQRINPTDPNNPIQDLHSMFLSMDVDSHARPAVLAYQRMVESMPPSSRFAVFLSVIRRCPASCLFFIQLIFAMNANWTTSTLLIPFMALECIRVYSWAKQLLNQVGAPVSTAFPNNPGKVFEALQELDPMVIVLSGDMYLNIDPPTLLVVWRNIRESVNALLMSLTAVRCIQTTAVAVDFVGNMISLAHLGWEVSQHGWLHGATLLVRDVIAYNQMQQHHQDSVTPTSGALARVDPSRPSYTGSAHKAVQSSQALHRNISVLLENPDDVGRMLQPLLGFLNTILFGWLPHQHHQQQPRSTVTIEEIDNKEEKVEDILLKHPASTAKSESKKASKVTETEETERNPIQDTVESTFKVHDSEIQESRVIVPTDPGCITTESTVEKLAATSSQIDTLNGDILDLLAVCEEKGCLHSSEKTRVMRKLSSWKEGGIPNAQHVQLLQGTVKSLHLISMEDETPHKGTIHEALQPEKVDEHSENDDWFGPSKMPNSDLVTASIPETKEKITEKESENKEEDPENLLMQIGSGIAVVGAVVGGIALAGALQRGQGSHKKE